MAGMSIESRTAEHEELPAKLKPIPAWVAGEQPVAGPLSHPSVVHAPPVKQDGSNLQPPKTPQGEPVSASTFQSTSNSWTGEAFVDPGPIAHQPSKIDLDTAKSPHEPAQIAADRLDEAKGDLAVARTRLARAVTNFNAVSENPYYSATDVANAKANVDDAKANVVHRELAMKNAAAHRLDEAEGILADAKIRLRLAQEKFEPMHKQRYPQYSLQEYDDAKHSVEKEEWAVKTADDQARKADEVYRGALANESTLGYTEMPSAL